jgi:glycosyltransferase involved in cell wall biosynthesis
VTVAPGSALAWHILTGEYPPAQGGVSGHTRLVALGLAAAHDEVHVWVPPVGEGLAEDPTVRVHPLPLGFGPRGLRFLARALQQERRPHRILVQYVPQAFGLKGINVPFCAWLAGLRGVEVYVMFHEVALPWMEMRLWKNNVAAAVMRTMAAMLLARADRVFVSTPSWDPTLRGLSIGWKGTTWLPAPSNVPLRASEGARRTMRARLGIAEDAPVVGHFGTYGLTTPLLEPALVRILEADPRRMVLLIGRGGDVFAEQLRRDPAAAGRVFATGSLNPVEIAEYLAACDVLMQPYPDGVSTRRTSTMAALALGVPVATNEGHLSESIWRASGGVEIADSAELVVGAVERLLGDPSRAAAVAGRGRRLYGERFSIEHVVASLRA